MFPICHGLFFPSSRSLAGPGVKARSETITSSPQDLFLLFTKSPGAKYVYWFTGNTYCQWSLKNAYASQDAVRCPRPLCDMIHLPETRNITNNLMHLFHEKLCSIKFMRWNSRTQCILLINGRLTSSRAGICKIEVTFRCSNENGYLYTNLNEISHNYSYRIKPLESFIPLFN